VASSFGWLDHSEQQRTRMLEVVSLFHEQGTVDELGIGLVRDAIADALFPGLSVLHTRPRYLLFVPWLASKLERERVDARRAPARLRQLEVDLIDALRAGDAGVGVIGGDARERLRQMPSVVYWGALRRFAILQHPGTLDQYLRSLDRFHQLRREAEHTDEDGAGATGRRANWHPSLPAPPDDLLEHTTLDLRPDEADYLEDRILTTVPGSLLAHLAPYGVATDLDLPWKHPAVSSAPPTLRATVAHARSFSTVLHGAALLYNLQLAEAAASLRDAEVDGDDLVTRYRDDLDAWHDELADDATVLDAWDLPAFWDLVLDRNPRIGAPTRWFVESWVARVTSAAGAGGRVADDEEARRLVRDREQRTKGALARLGNTRAIERWNGASGVGRLDYRWSGAARQLLADLAAARAITDAAA
jgi:hypothetical protein